MVNGYKYFLTLELRPTNCSRPLESEELVCAPDPAADTQLYSVEILEPAQLDSTPRLLTYDEVRPGVREQGLIIFIERAREGTGTRAVSW